MDGNYREGNGSRLEEFNVGQVFRSLPPEIQDFAKRKALKDELTDDEKSILRDHLASFTDDERGSLLSFAASNPTDADLSDLAEAWERSGSGGEDTWLRIMDSAAESVSHVLEDDSRVTITGRNYRIIAPKVRE